MHVVLIGGTGHVGSYLAPRLIEAGYRVTVVSRGQRQPYIHNMAWKQVNVISLDRSAEEKAGSFGVHIRDLKPDIVIDMISFTVESTRQLVEALKGQVQCFLHCSTAWVHGYTTQVPVSEDQPRLPIGEYGLRKAAIEAYLHEEARKNGFPETCILPGHIVGQGWIPLNPQGNFNPQVYTQLARGEELLMPNQGTDLLHHVHAEDVAQLFMKALLNWNAACGESFHAVSPAALTMRGYAQAVAGWFGQSAHLKFLPFEEWCTMVSSQDAQDTRGHLEHSPNCYSIAKAQERLGYQPRYTSLEAIHESVQALITNKVIQV